MEHVNNIDGEPNTAPRREASEQGDLVDSPPDGDAENERAPDSTDARQEESGEIDITPSAEAPPEEPAPAAALPVRWWELAAYAALLLAAAVSRLWDLGSRAVHHDESLHAYYSWILSNGSGYTHDPMMHGPFQFEATAAVFLVLGDSDYTSRLVYAVAGIALVAMPFLLRRRMGRLGALFASAMLAASPAMLYFSRFSRNDILMAVWTLGLVACAWRYIDEGKNRYLYAAAALLALAFATKETAFIISAVFGTFLLARLVLPGLAHMEVPTADGRTPMPRALWTLARGIWRAIGRSRNVLDTREGTLLVLLATLTLPQWAATAGLLQGTRLLQGSGLVLASPVGSPAIGAPTGGGLVIAALLVAALLGVSVYAGVRWRWPVWWRCAAIFYLLWTLLYSTFLTNPGGLLTGVWRSLGYWIVQQDVARGNQPWHYYFVITSLYEFLPLLLALVAGAYFFIRLVMALFGGAKYDIRREAFTWFLLLWSVATFGAYTVAAEKMPWLLVNVTLPLIFVAGKFMGEVVEAINWRWLVRSGAVSLAFGVPLALWLLWQLAFFGVGEGSASGPVALALIVTGLFALAGAGVFFARRYGWRASATFALLPLVAVLLVLTVRTGARATYDNGDVPVEMLVYTQTSPDVPRLLGELERAGTGQTIAIDTTSGFSWPWVWYLRDRERVNFVEFEPEQVDGPDRPPVVVVHRNNRTHVNDTLESADYREAQRVRHRWWFPETTYRGLTPGKIIGSLADREAWRRAMDYFMHREGVRDQLGSEDSYLYVARDLPIEYRAEQ